MYRWVVESDECSANSCTSLRDPPTVLIFLAGLVINPGRSLWLEQPLKPRARYRTANRFTMAAALVCLALSVVTTNGDAYSYLRRTGVGPRANGYARGFMRFSGKEKAKVVVRPYRERQLYVDTRRPLSVDSGRLRKARRGQLFFLCSHFRAIIFRCPTNPTRYVAPPPKTSSMRWRSPCASRAASAFTTPTNSCRRSSPSAWSSTWSDRVSSS